MGLNLSTNQCLTATVNITVPQPFTFMCWVQKSPIYFDAQSLLCLGDTTQTLSFNNIQAENTYTRAISFTGFAAAQDNTHLIDDGVPHFLCGVFSNSTITLYFDNNTPTSSAWSPSLTVAFNQFAIGRTVSDSLTEFFTGTIEHAACWNVALTVTQVGNLYNLSTPPTSISGLQYYFPFTNSLTDNVGTLSWSPSNLGSPTYTSLGIVYEEPYKKGILFRRAT